MEAAAISSFVSQQNLPGAKGSPFRQFQKQTAQGRAEQMALPT